MEMRGLHNEFHSSRVTDPAGNCALRGDRKEKEKDRGRLEAIRPGGKKGKCFFSSSNVFTFYLRKAALLRSVHISGSFSSCRSSLLYCDIHQSQFISTQISEYRDLICFKTDAILDENSPKEIQEPVRNPLQFLDEFLLCISACTTVPMTIIKKK